MVVREWREDDTEQLAEWFDFDDHLWAHIGGIGTPTRGALEALLIERMSQEIQGLSLLRAVEQDGDLVGYVSLWPRLSTASFAHIVVAPWLRGHGVEVARTALAYATEHALGTIVAPPIEWMKPESNVRFLKRIGMKPQVFGVL